jgi:hypothetical protein
MILTSLSENWICHASQPRRPCRCACHGRPCAGCPAPLRHGRAAAVGAGRQRGDQCLCGGVGAGGNRPGQALVLGRGSRQGVLRWRGDDARPRLPHRQRDQALHRRGDPASGRGRADRHRPADRGPGLDRDRQDPARRRLSARQDHGAAASRAYQRAARPCRGRGLRHRRGDQPAAPLDPRRADRHRRAAEDPDGQARRALQLFRHRLRHPGRDHRAGHRQVGGRRDARPVELPQDRPDANLVGGPDPRPRSRPWPTSISPRPT